MSVAKEIENKDAQIVKEVASKTSDAAGDGTTTATVLAHSMMREGLKSVSAGLNPMDLKLGIDNAVGASVAGLESLSKPVRDSKATSQVGAISANADYAIGDIFSVAMDKVRLEGVIKVGATAKVEKKEKKIRVEHALHGTRSKVEEGVRAAE